MNLNRLEYFVATVQNGSFSAAGKSLFVTPQALSKAVDDLEKDLGVKLLKKSGKGVSPTSFGLMFSERAAEALAGVYDLRSLAKCHVESSELCGKIVLSIAKTAYRGKIVDQSAIAELHQAYPLLRIEVLSNSSSVSLASVEAGAADAAIVLGRPNNPELEYIKLAMLELYVAVSADSPLASQNSVNICDLSEVPVALPLDFSCCYRAIKQAVSQRGLEPVFTEVHPSVGAQQDFLANSKGAIFVSADQELLKTYSGIAIKRMVKDDRIQIPVYMVYKNQKASHLIEGVAQYFIGVGKEATPFSLPC